MNLRVIPFARLASFFPVELRSPKTIRYGEWRFRAASSQRRDRIARSNVPRCMSPLWHETDIRVLSVMSMSGKRKRCSIVIFSV